MPRVLALIPARAESKRLPKKNILDFNGKPLIYWTLLLARDCKVISNVIISSDSPEILNFAREFPAFYFHNRPKILSSDESNLMDVVNEVANNVKQIRFKDYDYLLVLQPTSPLRITKDIEQALKLLDKNPKVQTCISYTMLPSSVHPSKIINFEPNGQVSSKSMNLGINGKELKPIAIRNGPAILLRRLPLKGENLIAEPILGLQMPWIRSIDIDTSSDFILAELIAKYLGQKAI